MSAFVEMSGSNSTPKNTLIQSWTSTMSTFPSALMSIASGVGVNEDMGVCVGIGVAEGEVGVGDGVTGVGDVV